MTDTVQKLLLARSGTDSPGLKFGDRTWSWREYLAACRSRADALLDLAEDGRPFHVGVLTENTPEFVTALGAGAVGGYVPVGIDTTRRGDGLARDVRRADCRVLLTDADHLPLQDGLDLGDARVLDTSGEEWPAFVAERARRPKQYRVAGAEDTLTPRTPPMSGSTAGCTGPATSPTATPTASSTSPAAPATGSASTARTSRPARSSRY